MHVFGVKPNIFFFCMFYQVLGVPHSSSSTPTWGSVPLGIFGCFDVRVTSDSDVGSWLDFG